MLHPCDQKFDVTGNLENFCELNKTLDMVGQRYGLRKHNFDILF